MDALDNGVNALPEFYNEDYLHFSNETTSPERTANEAEFIVQILGLKAGSRVLDLGCGFGRISNRLAARGCRVTGVEAVPILLDHAKRASVQEGLDVDYRLGELRDFVSAEVFDAAILWFYTFGYYDDAGNTAVLRRVAEALRPGGLLLLDQYSLSLLGEAASSEACSLVDLGSSLLIQRPIAEMETGRWGAERIVVRDGQIRRARFTCRCYSAPELKRMLSEAGLRCARLLGDGFVPLSASSKRMIVLAEKSWGHETVAELGC